MNFASLVRKKKEVDEVQYFQLEQKPNERPTERSNFAFVNYILFKMLSFLSE